jgi:CheY-like chemotaxis protein
MDEEANSTASKTVLLVDDDSFITVAYKDGLENAGLNVIVAGNGEVALNILQSTKPDLVLMDLIMPKMNGFELLQAMKENEALNDIPVIVLTNLSQDSDEAEARAYGIVDFLVKTNVSLNDVVLRVQQQLSDF